MILGLAILLAVSGVVPGWELTFLIGSKEGFNGGGFLFVLGLSLLISSVFLAFIGRQRKV
jgi:hypothetical protein